MPIDFEKMVSGAKADSDEKIAIESKRIDEETQQRRREFESATQRLMHEVLPTLLEAKRVFAMQDILLLITENWSNGTQPMRPTYDFQCSGPKIFNSRGGYSEPKGGAGQAWAYENQLRISANEMTYGGDYRPIAGGTEQALATAIETCLRTYLASKEKILSGPWR